MCHVNMSVCHIHVCVRHLFCLVLTFGAGFAPRALSVLWMPQGNESLAEWDRLATGHI